MNDIPDAFVAVAERLSRALAEEGDAIERDARDQLAAPNMAAAPGTEIDTGPLIVLDISATSRYPSRGRRHRAVFAIAAVVVVALALAAAVSRRDNHTAAPADARYFLPMSVPEGFVLNGAQEGRGNGNPSPTWRRVYVQREAGVSRRALYIESLVLDEPPSATLPAQPITIAGRNARIASVTEGAFIGFEEDFGCGYVFVSAVGYDTSSSPPTSLLDDLATIACAPTAVGSAAAITVPQGFRLEGDYDPVAQFATWCYLSYYRFDDPNNLLLPLDFSFGVSDLSPELMLPFADRKLVERNGRQYWTAPFALTSAPNDRTVDGGMVIWNDGPYRLSLSSALLGIDELLAVADSVRETTKAAFDDAVLHAQPAVTR